LANLRAVFPASSLLTFRISSTSFNWSTSGTNPAPCCHIVDYDYILSQHSGKISLVILFVKRKKLSPGRLTIERHPFSEPCWTSSTPKASDQEMR
jgi:hypothetical protein